MSSRSSGVTKVVLSRRMMSWVILSPSCSASRISRARSAIVGPALEHLLQQLGGAQRVLTGLVEEVEEDAVARNQGGQRHRARNYQSAMTAARRSAACPSHFSGGCGELRRARSRASPGISAIRAGVEPEQRVGPGADRDRALGVVAQGEAGDAEIARLLLDPARVGQHGRRRRPRARGSRGSPTGSASLHARGPARASPCPRRRVRGWTGKSTGIDVADRVERRHRLRRAAGRRPAPAGAA